MKIPVTAVVVTGETIMTQKRLALVVACALFIPLAMCPGKDPPPAEVTLPGDRKGRMESRWLAPYVHSAWIKVGDKHVASVRWLSADGKVRRELTGSDVSASSEFAWELKNGQSIIHGITGDWQMALPRKEGGYITATANGFFLHQYNPDPKRVAVDVYVGGKLARTFGPYRQYESSGIYHGSDGSLVLLTWKTGDNNTPQIVAAGPDGKVTMHVDCIHPVMSPVVAPEARGVLVQPNGTDRDTFSYYTAKGKVASYKPGPNAHCVTWLPKSATAVMSSSVGHDYRFHLVDWTRGKQLWDIRDPCAARVPGWAPRVAVAKDYLLFAGREYVKWGERQDPVRCLYAVDSKTGKTVARWHPTPHRSSSDRDEPWFFPDGPKLYVMTPDEFSEINLDDIAAKKRGWE
jgi:hypothetical protein